MNNPSSPAAPPGAVGTAAPTGDASVPHGSIAVVAGESTLLSPQAPPTLVATSNNTSAAPTPATAAAPSGGGGGAMSRSPSKEALAESASSGVSNSRSDDDIQSTVSKIKEVSPNQRYIRFGEIISQTGNIKCSFKAFDTRNGIEVAWHVINLSGLDDMEQEEVARSAAFLKDIHNKFIAEYLSIWVDAQSRRLHIITTLLESLRE